MPMGPGSVLQDPHAQRATIREQSVHPLCLKKLEEHKFPQHKSIFTPFFSEVNLDRGYPLAGSATILCTGGLDMI